jgi:SPP1 family phage portal protein
MIRVAQGAELTPENLFNWYNLWRQDRDRLLNLKKLYLNKDESGNAILKMPFAKKLTLTSGSATYGEGITLSAPEDLSEGQQRTFEEIQSLFKRQTIGAHDLAVVKDGCTFGRAYELAYMSDDEKPLPKVTKISPEFAFVVFDDTVENNSLYGVYFEEYYKGSQPRIKLYIYDSENKYTADFENTQKGFAGTVSEGTPHNMGRMPLTEYLNNDEEQGDFEQVIDLMFDRTEVHNLNITDMREVAKNYLKARNVKIAGRTEDEKRESIKKAKKMNLIEFESDEDLDDITLISKVENYTSVDVFGRDIDSKIYDLSMIPNLSDDNFAGNQSGVALELKLKPFKDLVKAKDVYIEKLYRRRLKMYLSALMKKSGEYEPFDAADVTVTIHRNWTENVAELAATVSALHATGLFSDEYLINKMPDADYETEKERRETEGKTNTPDANNASLENYAALFRGYGNGGGL